jgi:PAS domain S-box-containing protein
MNRNVQGPITDAEQRLFDVLESAPDAIIELDNEGRIVVLNRMAEQLFGYTRDELYGQTVEALIPEAVRGMHRRHRTEYLDNPATRPMGSGLKLEARRKDGSQFPVEISLSPVKSDGGYRVTAIIRDITERRQMEEQLRTVQEKYIRELELRNRDAERANQLKTEFLANMSHELRSPLHTIIGFSELLAEESEGALSDKQKRFLQHIHNDSLHLLDLINDLLDLSKIEAGRLELRYEAFHIGAVIEESLSSLRPRAQAKSLEIQTEVSMPFAIYADRMRFKQILHNLLSNAIKFTPDSGVIRVEAATQTQFARISISDTGIGITEDQHQAIFDKFYQVRSAIKGGSEGTGLGLAITKRLVEQQGGAIGVSSSPGSGSCFTFTVPLEVAHETSAGG